MHTIVWVILRVTDVEIINSRKNACTDCMHQAINNNLKSTSPSLHRHLKRYDTNAYS